MSRATSYLKLFVSYAKIIVPIAVLTVLVVSLIGSTMALACGYRWGASGMNSKWQWFNGCMVEYRRGRWIPEERYRAIPD